MYAVTGLSAIGAAFVLLQVVLRVEVSPATPNVYQGIGLGADALTLR
jgi:hypothetical protein